MNEVKKTVKKCLKEHFDKDMIIIYDYLDLVNVAISLEREFNLNLDDSDLAFLITENYPYCKKIEFKQLLNYFVQLIEEKLK